MKEQLLTAKEMAIKMKVTTQTIALWRKKKKIPFKKIGGSYRYPLFTL